MPINAAIYVKLKIFSQGTDYQCLSKKKENGMDCSISIKEISVTVKSIPMEKTAKMVSPVNTITCVKKKLHQFYKNSSRKLNSNVSFLYGENIPNPFF